MSCNSFSGTAIIDDKAIRFPEAMAMTKMFCSGEGEAVFLEALRTVNSYNVTKTTLTLISGDVAMMRFNRKP